MALQGFSLRGHEGPKNLVLVLPMVTRSAELCVARHASMRISPECTCRVRMHVTANVSCWAVAADTGGMPLPRPPPSACGRTVLRKQCPTPQQPNNFAPTRCHN